MRRARLLAGLLGLTALAACTEATTGPRSAPHRRHRPPRRPPVTPPPRDSPRTPRRRRRPPPAATVPLVLAVHATRTVADVPTDVARDLVARSARDRDLSVRWASLDQPGRWPGRGPHRRRRKAAEDLLDDVRDDDGVVAIVPATAVDATVRVLTVGGRHPLRDPARYPLETPAAERPGEVTTMSVVGDVMLGRRVAQASGDDPIRTLRPTAKRLAAAEITVGNLESTLSDDGSPTQGGDSFDADPEVIDGSGAGRLRPGVAGQQPRRRLRAAGAAADAGRAPGRGSAVRRRRPGPGRGAQAGGDHPRRRPDRLPRHRVDRRDPGGHRRPGRHQPAEHAAADRPAERAPARPDHRRHRRPEQGRSTWWW